MFGGFCMDQRQFSEIRRYLGKSQSHMARLLGTSLKSVQSFEQGWRNIPTHAERQILFFLTMKNSNGKHPCWETKNCPKERKEHCPAWEFHSGHLCWFISGTLCQGRVQATWRDKMGLCERCVVFRAMIPEAIWGLWDTKIDEAPCP
jgi:hypothetical protein